MHTTPQSVPAMAVSTPRNNPTHMAKYSCNLEAAWALHVHEVTVRALDQPLQLVLSLLCLDGRVQQVVLDLETI